MTNNHQLNADAFYLILTRAQVLQLKRALQYAGERSKQWTSLMVQRNQRESRPWIRRGRRGSLKYFANQRKEFQALRELLRDQTFWTIPERQLKARALCKAAGQDPWCDWGNFMVDEHGQPGSWPKYAMLSRAQPEIPWDPCAPRVESIS